MKGRKRYSSLYNCRGAGQNQSDNEGETMTITATMYQCQTVNCGYIYDPSRGDRKGKISKGTAFEDLPDDWKCPICGAGKKFFKPLAIPGQS